MKPVSERTKFRKIASQGLESVILLVAIKIIQLIKDKPETNLRDKVIITPW